MSDEENFSKVKFNHEYAEKRTERRKYKAGWHFGVVTTARRQMSKTGEKNPDMAGVFYKMLVSHITPIRDPNDVTSLVGKGIDVYQCLPFYDDEWSELDREVDSKDGPIHIQKVLERNMIIFSESTRDQLAALLPEQVPAKPRRVGEGPYVFEGEEIEKDQYQECDTKSRDAAGEVAEQLWNEGPEALVDKGCYFLIAYEPESKYPDSPKIKAWSSTPPVDFKTGEELEVLHGEMSDAEAAAADEEEGGDEEAPKKSNGAKGKPSATAKTVAQAAANAKGKAGAKSKSSRR